ncbi:MAG: recombinase family protein, partial [Anaerolineales bacterium]|nr:recombinase family protein [Anaerolineales bacterium]
MRVVIYARVSTQRQAQAQTIGQQLERLTAYASQQGWAMPEKNIFRDDGDFTACMETRVKAKDNLIGKRR